jgi:NADH:ubiquinone oxidoreductase subunit 6 (subunit J)
MILAPALLAGAAALGFAGASLVTRRIFASAGALAACGASVSLLFLSAGAPGLGAVALAGSWGIAGAGLVVGWNLSRVESPEEAGRRGPWVLALASTAILIAALGLGLLAVDWPKELRATLAHTGQGSIEGWALAVLALAAALALACFSPREDGGA